MKYLSGPMTGYPDYNFPAFTVAAELLRAQGHGVVSAHEVKHPGACESQPWTAYLRGDIAAMVQYCTEIVLLPGWPQSKGACLELKVALELEMPVYLWVDGALIDVNQPKAEVTT